jgi:hypothetical protein
MRPTPKMRWLRVHGNDLGSSHPSAVNLGTSPWFMVLQQWWQQAPKFECDADDHKLYGEWRDVPIENFEDH